MQINYCPILKYRYLSIVFLLVITVSSKSATLVIEAFPSGPPKSGWAGGGTASSIGTNERNDRLEFSASNYGRFSLQASSSASNGAFAGNFLSAKISNLEFDLFLFESSTITSIYLELTRFTVPNLTWQYSLTPPILGTQHRYSIPITSDASGWTRTSGFNDFSSILSNVERVSIVFANSGGPVGNISGFIDNVTTIPEPGVTFLITSGLLLVSSRRRR